MESDTIRFIIEDIEHEIIWAADTDEKQILDVITYIVDILRKKYFADEFFFRDQELKHYQLTEIAKFKTSPIYLSIPHRTTVKTFNKPDRRKLRHTYNFISKLMISIQKFENEKKLEQIEMKLSTLRTINESNADKQFDDPELSEKFKNLKVDIKSADTSKPISNVLNNPFKFVSSNNGDVDQELSPTFGSVEKKTFSKLGVDDPEKIDLSKRQKVPVGDGKSQSGFMKLQADNKNPAGKKVEPQLYTIDDVKKHSTDQDAWIVINGKIYDVTKYLDYHPGGKAKLMQGVGKDGTALFSKITPWVL